MLSGFHVENYKCLRDVTVPLTPIHVLIGQNDAGKSSLLEAMYAFFRSSDYQLHEAFSGHWLGDDLVYENAAEPNVTLEGTWDGFGRYGLSVAFRKEESRICIPVDEWHSGPSAKRKSFGTRNMPDTEIYQRKHILGVTENTAIEEEAGKLLNGAHLYRLDPRLMAIPSELSPTRKFRLDPDGFGLAGLLDDILGYDIEQFAKIRNEFCRFFPQFRTEIGRASCRERV